MNEVKYFAKLKEFSSKYFEATSTRSRKPRTGVTRVLCIDDDRLLRKIAKSALERDAEFSLTTADSAAVALSLVRARAFDLILLDVVMPEMDGPALLRALRNEPRARAIPVAFLTAQTQARDVTHLLELGAIGVLKKPFDPATFATEVRALLAKIPMLA
jgi:CheY-like chemotaxis protein